MPHKRRRPSKFYDWIVAFSSYSGEECLIWPFTHDSRGYAGVMKFGSFLGERRREMATRVMCEKAHGAPPTKEHEAAHSCGRGHMGCISPVHLSWRTPKENCADKTRHGTQSIGSKNPASKLVEDDIPKIRELLKSSTIEGVAKIFDVCPSNIWKIKSKVAWRHVP